MNLKQIVPCFFTTIIFLMSFLLAPAMSSSADGGYPDTSGFVIIGEAEKVNFQSKNLHLKARIDTGAQTSSLGVTNKLPFERDGKKWLKFSVQDPKSGTMTDFERPIVRIAEIKRHDAKAQERPVVNLKILLGNVEMEREFTLADRSKYTFPVLIGRNVLAGKFLVDVNRKYTTQLAGGKEE